MRSAKLYADIQARIADGTLSYSPEVSAALYAHGRRMRAIETRRLIGDALRELGTRLSAAATAFAKTPDAATR